MAEPAIGRRGSRRSSARRSASPANSADDPRGELGIGQAGKPAAPRRRAPAQVRHIEPAVLGEPGQQHVLEGIGGRRAAGGRGYSGSARDRTRSASPEPIAAPWPSQPDAGAGSVWAAIVRPFPCRQRKITVRHRNSPLQRRKFLIDQWIECSCAEPSGSEFSRRFQAPLLGRGVLAQVIRRCGPLRGLFAFNGY